MKDEIERLKSLKRGKVLGEDDLYVALVKNSGKITCKKLSKLLAVKKEKNYEFGKMHP